MSLSNDSINITPGQMVALGHLVSNGRLIEPDTEELEEQGRWEVQQTHDGNLRVRDIERDIYISPGGKYDW